MDDLERHLISKAISGDVDAFEKIVLTYEKKVYNIAYNMFTNEQDAYDASQEVFLKLYKNLHSFKFDSSFATWLHRIAVNTCIDEYRKKKKHLQQAAFSFDEPLENESSSIKRQIKDDGLTPEEQIVKHETVSEVQRAIENLKEEHKTIIILRDIRGHSYEEVAEILACSVGTVKSRLSRARSALKQIILDMREQKT